MAIYILLVIVLLVFALKIECIIDKLDEIIKQNESKNKKTTCRCRNSKLR